LAWRWQAREHDALTFPFSSGADAVSDTRTKIAAGATLLALGGLAGVALSAESRHATSSAATATPPVEVRTEIVRRTVHVFRHEKPKKVSTPPVRAAVPVPAAAPPRAVVRAVSAPAPAPSPAPVRTRTSGGSGGGKGDDGGSEGRDD
jgi:hypothetical protein